MYRNELPVPPHFHPEKAGEVWKVAYQEIAGKAEQWAKRHHIMPASDDTFRICLVAVDVQNSFCLPGFELFVGGRSGTGAVDDNRRLCEFIYRNLALITQICPTMDTHQAMQIFHAVYLVNDKGEHPAPFTIISEEDVLGGVWKFNPHLNFSFRIAEEYGQRHLLHYTKQLKKGGKYDLMIWPYHAILGGIGHALVPAVEEAIYFHCIARYSQPEFHVKGDKPFTEHYSVLGPEVLEGPYGEQIAMKDDKFFRKLFEFDAIVIAGQAKSHCVAWTIQDLLEDILTQDRRLAEKIYLLEDCTSPVVVSGVIDYTDHADAAFRRFADAGMHIVRSTDPIDQWPGIKR
jgi:nicotinamidase-related amidase